MSIFGATTLTTLIAISLISMFIGSLVGCIICWVKRKKKPAVILTVISGILGTGLLLYFMAVAILIMAL